MYNQAANQIIALLDDGQDAQARALFMKHLAAHCRKIDQALGRILEKKPYTDERLWRVFNPTTSLECVAKICPCKIAGLRLSVMRASGF